MGWGLQASVPGCSWCLWAGPGLSTPGFRRGPACCSSPQTPPSSSALTACHRRPEQPRRVLASPRPSTWPCFPLQAGEARPEERSHSVEGVKIKKARVAQGFLCVLYLLLFLCLFPCLPKGFSQCCAEAEGQLSRSFSHHISPP